MLTFELEKIEELEGKQTFYKLLVNGRCELDSFWMKCSKDALLRKQLFTLQARLEFIADLKYHHLDRTKFKELKGRKRNDPYKDYEIKTKDLRVYFFKDEPPGQIIALGGKKKTQSRDISRLRQIKLNYFRSKNR